MLEYLHIRNLALIEDMELEFAPGMNVLTGETGSSFNEISIAYPFNSSFKSSILSGDKAHTVAQG